MARSGSAREWETEGRGGGSLRVDFGPLADGFYVQDNGPGNPEDERVRGFEAGFSTKDDARGFGLASVRQLVVAHGWDLTATEGGGAGRGSK